MSIAIHRTKSDMDEAIDRVVEKNERVIIKRDGKPAAALVSLEDLEYLTHIEAFEDEEDLRVLKEREGEERIPFEQVKKELGL